MKFHFWNIFLSLFLVGLAVFGYLWLAANNHLVQWIPLSDFFLMALAIMRLIRLFTYDNITAFIRAWFVGADPDSFLGTMGILINCPWCMGLWFSLIVVFFYFATPIAWYAILVLALSSVASFFQIFSNFIGWSAELKKREAQSPALPR
jgi:hypothetical protein